MQTGMWTLVHLEGRISVYLVVEELNISRKIDWNRRFKNEKNALKDNATNFDWCAETMSALCFIWPLHNAKMSDWIITDDETFSVRSRNNTSKHAVENKDFQHKWKKHACLFCISRPLLRISLIVILSVRINSQSTYSFANAERVTEEMIPNLA